MRQYWVIAPYDHKQPEWEKVWRYNLENGFISMGWNKLGDVSSLGEKALRGLVVRTYPDASAGSNQYSFRSMKYFYHSVKKGDVIIARRGVKKIVAVGTVTHEAYFERNKNPHTIGHEGPYHNHLDVRWRTLQRAFNKVVFARAAIYPITEQQFHALTQSKRPLDEGGQQIQTKLVDSSDHRQLGYQYRSKEHIRKAHKDEERLMIDFRTWLNHQGRKLEVAKYGGLRCDGYERQSRILIEAKSSTSREHIRMAVGELLDYSFQIRNNLGKSRMAILLPEKPDPASVNWLSAQKISLIWRENGGFSDNAKGNFCGE